MIFWNHLGLQFKFDTIFCPLELWMTALLAEKYRDLGEHGATSISNIGGYLDLLVKISARNSNDVVCQTNNRKALNLTQSFC